MVAATVWGSVWHDQKILCHCNNQAVVAVLCSRTSKHPQIMHMLRCLFFIEASYGFELSCAYISTRANHLANDLSRNNITSFLSKVPSAGSKSPVPIPTQLLVVLLGPAMYWTLPGWTQHFRATFTMALPHRPIGHTDKPQAQSCPFQVWCLHCTSDNTIRRYLCEICRQG